MIQEADHRRSRLGRDLGVIILLAALLSLPSLFTRDLWNPDEPRYMEVAREMFVLHEYVIPHLNGEVYSEKPPMFFWLTGLLWKAGLGLKSGRILVALVSLGTLLTTYFFSRRFLSGNGPLFAAIATVSLMLFAIHARIGVIDPLQTFLVSAATFCGYLALRRVGRRPWAWWLAAYALAGLATLTKGPVGFIIPGVSLLAYGLLDRKRVSGGGRVHLAGALLFVGIVAAWLVPAIVIGGQTYTETILLKQNLGRVVRSYSHRNPVYYFLVRAPLFFLPWSLLLPLAFYASVKHRREEGGSLPLFATAWLGATVAFFSCVSGKRIGYVMPTSPAVGILMGWYLTSGIVERHPRWRSANVWLARITFALFGLIVVALMAGALVPGYWVDLADLREAAASDLSQKLGPRWQLTTVALLALPLASCILGWRWAGVSLQRTGIALALTVLLFANWFDLSVAPVLNEVKSARVFCEDIRPFVAAEDELYLYGTKFSGVINVYTGRVSIPVIKNADELRSKLLVSNAFVISDMKRFGRALTEEEIRRHMVYRGRIGHREMVLLKGSPPEEAPPAEGGAAQ